MNDEILNELRKNNQMLSALLSITVDRHLRDTDLAKPRPRSIDRMLTDAGLPGVEVAKLLGKTPQAVSAVLSNEGKTAGKKTKTAKSGATGNVTSPENGGDK